MGAVITASVSMAETVIRIQSVLATSSDEVRMVENFAADVAALTEGSAKIEILPAGAVVGPLDFLDAVECPSSQSLVNVAKEFMEEAN